MNNEGTICGHERDVLRGVLLITTDWSQSDDGRATGTRIQAYNDAYMALRDPAIVAKMMAVEGNRLGLALDCDGDIGAGTEPRDGHVMLYIWTEYYELPQARAILLAWLDLADGDSDGALRALGSVT